MKKENGFTLIETMIALFIGMMMLTAIYTVVNSAQRSSTAIERKVIAQQDARAALELMAMEIRMASYNPNSTTGNWLSNSANNFDTHSYCTSVSGNQNYLGIQEATATSITVEMDMNENCTDKDDPICMRNYTGNLNPNEVIRYNYDTTTTNLTRYITRETQCGGDMPFLGNSEANAALGQPRTVRVINNDLNPVIPVFRYYNGSGACILEVGEPATGNCVGNEDTSHLPDAIPNIRRIEITLVVETENDEPGAPLNPITNRRTKTIIYSTSVIPRNHIPIPTY